METTERLVIDLPKELVDKLRELVASGEFSSESDAVEALLKASYYGDELDEEELREVRAAVAEADADIVAGRLHEADEVHAQLRAIIKASTARSA
jgi:Arc/MetJ-type ribon-helix-helix transcriptional regulator